MQPSCYIGTDVYKIGRFKNLNLSRPKSYGLNSKPYLINYCYNHIEVENQLIQKFNKNFELVQGREYFRGSLKSMVLIFNSIVSDNNFKSFDKIEDERVDEFEDETENEYTTGDESEYGLRNRK